MAEENVRDGTATIDLFFGDGIHTFKIGIKQWRELQAKLNFGPIQIWSRIIKREFLIDEPREVLRIGLIGGGMQPVASLRLVEFYFDERPLVEWLDTCDAILKAAILPPSNLELKKNESRPAETKSQDSGILASSTATVQ